VASGVNDVVETRRDGNHDNANRAMARAPENIHRVPSVPLSALWPNFIIHATDEAPQEEEKASVFLSSPTQRYSWTWRLPARLLKAAHEVSTTDYPSKERVLAPLLQLDLLPFFRAMLLPDEMSWFKSPCCSVKELHCSAKPLEASAAIRGGYIAQFILA
jgi:hypothetical protein